MTTVAEYARKETIVSCKPGATLREASAIMAEKKVGSIIVVDEAMRLLGIFTERDLVRALASGADPDRDRVEDYMTRQVITATPYESLVSASQKMLEHGIRHLPVVDSSGRVIGIISMRDVLRALFSSHEFP
ncbi:MAG: CBS domain-containing protein [Desulfurococcales archaeon]|nr:CBS domain-containing protein [Desulfurococcales archaeon]